jgi:hypothetical protein
MNGQPERDTVLVISAECTESFQLGLAEALMGCADVEVSWVGEFRESYPQQEFVAPVLVEVQKALPSLLPVLRVLCEYIRVARAGHNKGLGPKEVRISLGGKGRCNIELLNYDADEVIKILQEL